MTLGHQPPGTTKKTLGQKNIYEKGRENMLINMLIISGKILSYVCLF